MSKTFWTRARINYLSIGVIAAILIAIPVSCFRSKSKDGSVIQEGDVAASYTVAVMLHNKLEKKLYDHETQLSIQSVCCPNISEGLVPFAYPPYVAFFLSPLAMVSFEYAKWMIAGVMFLLLVLSILIGARYAPILKENYLATTAFFLSCAPVLVSVVAAQNVALSMCLYSGALWSLSQGNKRGDWLCGICLGLWLFKPPYALIVISFFLFSRSWKILTGALTITLLYYLVGAMVCGWSWPIEWLSRMQTHGMLCLRTIANYLISILGVLKAASIFIHHKEVTFGLLDLIPSVAFFLWVASKFWFAGNLPEGPGKRHQLRKLLDLAGPAALLVSPQPLYYDFGICLLPVARYLKLSSDKSVTIFLLLAILISLATIYRHQVPVQPLFLVVLGIFLYINRQSPPTTLTEKQT